MATHTPGNGGPDPEAGADEVAYDLMQRHNELRVNILVRQIRLVSRQGRMDYHRAIYHSSSINKSTFEHI